MAELLLLNNRYQLLHPIGTGGMAVVHKAQDKLLERIVAVKLLRDDYSNDTTFRDRFRQEARSAANLSHPNIVTVHDFGLDQKYLFIVMEFLPGTDLKTMIRQKGHFSTEETLNLMIQACAGVGYAHRAGLVHCDIKPHNMLVSPDQRLKVTDFGIARALATIPSEEQSEVVWGSPHYFSPEQATGLAPSPASDVYSLGVILYEMLTGQLPFNANDPTELAKMHRESTPRPPRSLNPNIPQQMEDIILKVLSKEPAARYRTADQLGRLLAGLAQGQGSKTSDAIFTAPVTPKPPQKPLEEPQPISSILNQGKQNLSQADLIETIPPAPPKREKTSKVRTAQNTIDWITWALGLTAFTLLLGLIPFWLFIYLTLTP